MFAGNLGGGGGGLNIFFRAEMPTKQWKPRLSQGQAGFVPWTILGTKGGINILCVKVYVPFSIAKTDLELQID